MIVSTSLGALPSLPLHAKCYGRGKLRDKYAKDTPPPTPGGGRNKHISENEEEIRNFGQNTYPRNML